jgi:GDP-L-fucose synthase
VVQLSGFRGTIAWDPSKPDGQPRRCLDVTRAKEQIGFEATMPLEEGLRRTIQWFEQHRPTGGPSGRYVDRHASQAERAL